MNTEVMFSTGNNNWSTPQSFFDRLNSVFHFTLDPCADDTNHKCELYYTEQNDGLAKNWGGQTVFCNPPYSRRTKGKSGQEDWIEKCCCESRENGITAVMLIPARTDTKAQHDFIFPNAKYVCFVKGRLRFLKENTLLRELKNVLDYDQDTGIFTWKKDIYAGKNNNRILVCKGDRAGFVNHDYRYIKYNGKRYAEHRLAFLFTYGVIPQYIDHINGDKSDNRISNLRECSKNQNGQNRPKLSNNSTGYKGVYVNPKSGKYISKIRINGELKYIGTFNTPEEAAKAYDNEAIENFGEFANLNFEQETKDYGIRDDAAPFPSEVVVFTNQDFDQQIRTLEDLGKWIKLKD